MEKPVAHTVGRGRTADRRRPKHAGSQDRDLLPEPVQRDGPGRPDAARLRASSARCWAARPPCCGTGAAAYYQARPWRGRWQTSGGGVLINQAIHTLDLLEWLLGDVDGSTGTVGRRRAGRCRSTSRTPPTLVLDHAGGRAQRGVRDRRQRRRLPGHHGDRHRAGDAADPRRPDGQLRRRADRDGRRAAWRQSGGRAYWGASHELLIADFYRRLADPEPFWIAPREAAKIAALIDQIYRTGDQSDRPERNNDHVDPVRIRRRDLRRTSPSSAAVAAGLGLTLRRAPQRLGRQHPRPRRRPARDGAGDARRPRPRGVQHRLADRQDLRRRGLRAAPGPDAARRRGGAHFFGAPYIRIFSFFLRPGADPADHRDEVLRRMRALARVAEDAGVVLLHENEKEIYGDVPSRCLDIVALGRLAEPAAGLGPGQLRPGGRPALHRRVRLAAAPPGVRADQGRPARPTARSWSPATATARSSRPSARCATTASTGSSPSSRTWTTVHALGGFSGPELFRRAWQAFTDLLKNEGDRVRMSTPQPQTIAGSPWSAPGSSARTTAR